MPPDGGSTRWTRVIFGLGLRVVERDRADSNEKETCEMTSEHEQVEQRDGAAEMPKAGMPMRRRVPRMAVLLIALAVLASGALALLAHAMMSGPAGTTGSTGSTGGTTGAHATATATALPTTVYTADWSKGLDGWKLPAGWQASDGTLVVVSGAQTVSATAPYVATAKHYQIEMEIEVQAVGGGPDGARQGQYEIIATDDHGNMLWTAKAMCFARPVASCIGGIYGWTGSVGKFNPGAGGGISESDFASGSGAQDYLVDVHEQAMDFCASGNCLGDATSNTPLAPAHLSFSAQNVRLVVSRFVVKVL